MSETLRVPLRGKGGKVRAWMLIDRADEGLIDGAWLTKGGYAMKNEERDGKRRMLYLHRLIMDVDDPAVQVDHINRNRLDNRRCNLRLVTASQQHQNRGGQGRRISTSRYRGVSWDRERRKWRAVVILNGVQHELGRFVDEEEAAAVTSAFRAKHMPYSEDAKVAA